MKSRVRVAKFVFSLDAILGILSIGGAALYLAALTSGNAGTAFVAIFVPFAVLWSSFCYWAYKGLTSEKAVLKFVFWSYVVGNVFGFPVGTAVAGVSIWLWRDLRRQNESSADAW
jgi:hypothetical protein